jgi:hypothetical protein
MDNFCDNNHVAVQFEGDECPVCITVAVSKFMFAKTVQMAESVKEMATILLGEQKQGKLLHFPPPTKSVNTPLKGA